MQNLRILRKIKVELPKKIVKVNFKPRWCKTSKLKNFRFSPLCFAHWRTLSEESKSCIALLMPPHMEFKGCTYSSRILVATFVSNQGANRHLWLFQIRVLIVIFGSFESEC